MSIQSLVDEKFRLQCQLEKAQEEIDRLNSKLPLGAIVIGIVMGYIMGLMA